MLCNNKVSHTNIPPFQACTPFTSMFRPASCMIFTKYQNGRALVVRAHHRVTLISCCISRVARRRHANHDLICIKRLHRLMGKLPKLIARKPVPAQKADTDRVYTMKATQSLREASSSATSDDNAGKRVSKTTDAIRKTLPS